MFIFNSKKNVKLAVSNSSLPDIPERPGNTRQNTSVPEQAGQLLNNVAEITKQRKRNATKERPYAIFVMDGYQHHDDNTPGFVNGSYQVVSSDVDGDGVEDRDELGRPIAKTLRDHLDRAVDRGEYIRDSLPYSLLSSVPRVQKWLSGIKASSLPVYIHKDHHRMVNQLSQKSTIQYIDEERLRKNLAASAAQGQVFTSDKIKDIDNISMRKLHDPDGGTKGLISFFTDQQLPIANQVIGLDHCVCGSHRDNHGTGACRTFLPMVVPDGNGGYMDGNEYRSRKSPLRVRPPADNDNMSLRRVIGDRGPSTIPDYDQDNQQLRVLITDSVPHFQRIYNIPSKILNSIMLPPEKTAWIKSKLKLCTTCNGKAVLHEARSGTLTNDEMLGGMHTYQPVTNPITGKKTLQPVGSEIIKDWAMRGTEDDVCPDCDPDNFSREELEEYAENYPSTTGKLTADEVRQELVNNPGRTLAPGKGKITKTQGFLNQMVDQRPRNPVYKVDAPSAGAGIAYGAPDPNCTTCGGAHHHREGGKPCDCRIADPSVFDIDNPVAPPGSPDFINKDGSLSIDPTVVMNIMNEASKAKQQTLLPKERTDTSAVKLLSNPLMPGERIIPNAEASSPVASFFRKKHKDPERPYLNRGRGTFGMWSNWILGNGKPALDDTQQQNVISSMPSGPVITAADKENFKLIRAEIKSGANAKECGASQQLKAVVDFLRTNADSLAPAAGSTPPIPSGAARMPSFMMHVDPVMIADGDVDVDSPAFGGAHHHIAPHIARIEQQMRSLKRNKLLDKDDHQFDQHLQNIYGLASTAANNFDNWGTANTEQHKTVSEDLLSSVKDMTTHLLNRYGEDGSQRLQMIMPSVVSMVHPYLPDDSKTDSISQ